MKRIALVISVWMVALISSAQSYYIFPKKDSTSRYIRLLFAGDAMQHSPQLNAAYNSKKHTYNYEPNFRYLRSYIDEADVNIVNVETTFPGSNYSGYPRFRTPDAFFYSLVDAGFQVFALANNHVMDADQKGLQRTLKVMQDYPNMGAYLNAEQREERYPIILNVGGLKIALFNTTYGTNQLLPVKPNIVNYIETEQIEIDIANSLKDESIDLRIMMVHWGTEYQLQYNAYQHGLAQWFADLGFDVVIGSHPHVVQGYEVITAADGRLVPVVYSLGNMVSNQRWKDSNGGVLALVDICLDTKQVSSVLYVPFYVHKGKLAGDGDPNHPNTFNYYCIPTDDYLEGKLPFTLPTTAVDELKVFDHDTKERVKRN